MTASVETEIEFFTFLTGLQNKELLSLKTLIDTFPYKASHKINIIDKSSKLKEKFEKKEKIYHSERHYVIKHELDFDFQYWTDLKDQFKDSINVINAQQYSTHVEGVHEVLTKLASKKYVIIMDSDIKFINKNYLSDMVDIIKDFNSDENLASIGEIYQEAPFSLPFKRYIPQEFFKLFLNDRRSSFKNFIRNSFLFFLHGKKNKNERIHKLPRIFTSLILINRELYNKYKMNFNYLWLEVFDKYKNDWLSNRIMGDAGAAFLFQIAQYQKKFVNISYKKYIQHSRKGSRPTKKKDFEDKNWLRFDF